MHKAIAMTLLFGFLFIAIFGFAAMKHESGGHHHGCIAATARASPCTDSTNPFGFVAFHLDAFKSFTGAPAGNIAVAVLVSVLLLVFAARRYSPAPDLSRWVAFLPLGRLFLERHCLSHTLRKVHFLALLEHSPVRL